MDIMNVEGGSWFSVENGDVHVNRAAAQNALLQAMRRGAGRLPAKPKGTRRGRGSWHWAKVTAVPDLLDKADGIAKGLKSAEGTARKTGATKANSGLEKVLDGRERIRPRNSVDRPGRTTEPIKGNLRWVAGAPGGTGAAVGLDAKGAQRVKHWRIIEIGTGESAVQRRGRPGKVGRPRNDRPGEQTYKIPSQAGRVLPFGLGFGPSPAGKYYAPSSARRGRDSVHDIRELQPTDGPLVRIRIRREIEGAHMVRDSAREGYREYRKELLAASRASLKGISPKRT